MAVTHKKLAELLHVSQSTVSKALSGSREVSPELAKKITESAKSLGYFRKKREISRSYASAFSPEIAILVPEIISVYYSDIATRLSEKIKEKNGRTSVYITEFDNEYISYLLDRLYNDIRADGVVILSGVSYRGKVTLPTVSFSDSTKADGICRIENDYKCGMRNALEYLSKLGHDFIGFIGEPLTAQKNGLFGELTEELSIRGRLYTKDSRFEEIGVLAAHEVLTENKSERPTAFICAYDEVAFGFMSELSKHGLKIPQDLSVIGTNDIQAAKYSSPPLTTIAVDSDNAVGITAEILMDSLLEKQNRLPQSVKIPTKLIIRESTCTRQKYGC